MEAYEPWLGGDARASTVASQRAGLFPDRPHKAGLIARLVRHAENVNAREQSVLRGLRAAGTSAAV